MEVPGTYCFIGVDPGGTCGIAWGSFSQFIGTGRAPGRREWDICAASCDPSAFLQILDWRLHSWAAVNAPVLVLGEKFVQSNRRARKQSDHDLTRELLNTARQYAKALHIPFVLQTAAEVKPWASDKRLEAVGLSMAPKMRDARDAARHLVFGAVKSGRAKDPLA